MLTLTSEDSLDTRLTDYVSRLTAHRKQFRCHGVNRPSALIHRPASQLTMSVNFAHFQCAKVKFWNFLTNTANLIIAKQQHTVFIPNVTFHLTPNKIIKVKVMHFGGMLTKEYVIAFVRPFCSSSQESKYFYSLNTSFFFCYLFSKIILFFSNYRK